MNKIFGLLITLLFLNGCAESIALLGTSASNGKILQSSVNSAISYGVKKQTGKTPLEHAMAYAEEKILRKQSNLAYHLLKKLTLKFVLLLKSN